MKIILNNIPLVRGNNFCEIPKSLQITGSKDIQVLSLLGAPTASVTDHGNLKTTLTFQSTRQHDSSDQASHFVLQHATSLSTEHGTLTIFLENPDSTVFVLHDATVKSVSSFPDGVCSYHKYEIIGSKFEQKSN